MGFSIGGFLSSLAGSALSSIPIVGPLIGAAASGFGPNGMSRVQPALFPAPRVPSQAGPTVVQAGAVIPLLRGARTLIASLLGRASAAIGKRISRAGVLSLVREVGITAAATALALTTVEIAQIIAAKPTRRRRGITASQIATTKATMRRLDSLNRAIAKACPPAAARRALIRRK